MFNKITGILKKRSLSNCFLATGGIEWEISISSVTAGSLPEEEGEVSLYTVLIHREDMMRLYGFWTSLEREIFLSLLKVNGIGPKQAIKILSRSKPEEILHILNSGDLDLLSKFPGVGLKTAQKIILALKGKLISPEDSGSDRSREIVDALVDMGFDRGNVKKVVDSLLREGGDLEDSASEQQIFKQAIVILSS